MYTGREQIIALCVRSTESMNTTTPMTAREIGELEDDGFRYELIAGELIRMPPAKPLHSRIAFVFAKRPANFVDPLELGMVLESSAGYRFEEDPDTVLAPDVSFIRRERLSATMDWNDYFRITPHIAFEVRSPSECRAQIERKVRNYLDSGVLLVIFADSDKRQLTLCATNQPPRVLTGDDVLSFEDIVPGFSIAVADLFTLPAWLQPLTNGTGR